MVIGIFALKHCFMIARRTNRHRIHTVQRRIHIFGASGSGTSTLGRALAVELNIPHLDTDAYYWKLTDPPFTYKREPAERLRRIYCDIEGEMSWVLSGSLCGWGDPLIPHFTVAVFLFLEPAERMQRLAVRECSRYGDRILPSGDLCTAHLEFMDWARSYDSAQTPTRSLDLHERWMNELPCPLIKLDSSRPVEELVREVVGIV